MDGDPISLAAKRAEKAQDCTKWSERDALVEVLRALDAGEINPEQLMVHFWDRKPGGDATYRFYGAKMNYEQTIALLAIAQRRILCDWCGPT